MADAATNRFQVRPGELATASETLNSCSSELGRTRDDVSLAPPASAFGLLPESAELAAALDRCVQRSTTDLAGATDLSATMGGGLSSCARNYADLDATHAIQIGRVINV